MPDIRKMVQDQRDFIINNRRMLHLIPETAFQEKKTGASIGECLEREGLKVQKGIAGTGVVGLMETGVPGPTLMVRADMDALPITEETGLPFASTHQGVMHACGHDGHMAMVLGAARILNTLKDRLKGNIKFVFQPAEEAPGGARGMIDMGVMADPPVDYALGCHLWPALAEGTLGIRPGTLMAAMDRFALKIFGKGGHGAMPHLCVDALDVGAQVMNALQRIVSRHMNPLHPAVVTVGSFHGGTAFNIIAGEAILEGTTRTFDEDIWESLEGRLERVIEGICRAMGAGYELTYTRGCPPLVNDPVVCRVVRRSAEAVVGPERVVEPEPTMGGEDMAYFLQRAKGCFFFLGTGREGRPALHTPTFDFNEDVLPLGVETFCRAAMEILG